MATTESNSWLVGIMCPNSSVQNNTKSLLFYRRECHRRATQPNTTECLNERIHKFPAKPYRFLCFLPQGSISLREAKQIPWCCAGEKVADTSDTTDTTEHNRTQPNTTEPRHNRTVTQPNRLTTEPFPTECGTIEPRHSCPLYWDISFGV